MMKLLGRYLSVYYRTSRASSLDRFCCLRRWMKLEIHLQQKRCRYPGERRIISKLQLMGNFNWAETTRKFVSLDDIACVHIYSLLQKQGCHLPRKRRSLVLPRTRLLMRSVALRHSSCRLTAKYDLRVNYKIVRSISLKVNRCLFNHFFPVTFKILVLPNAARSGDACNLGDDFQKSN